MKLVVNYSKDYAVAVVALDVGYDADLRAVFDCLRQVGRQLRAESDAVLGETDIEWHHRLRAVIDDDPHVHAGQAGLSRARLRRRCGW